MNAATITVKAPRDDVAAVFSNGDIVREAFGDEGVQCRFSYIDAPGARGTEIHASCEMNQKAMKSALRKCRALLEAGEIPTGARRR
ncbi:MAG: hypothetical protein JO030_03140 [Candidatus Eremiobacteraeota bacterium]|nr:hypothetical protein [Candidatus Eremiobacteraeota bacterium]